MTVPRRRDSTHRSCKLLMASDCHAQCGLPSARDGMSHLCDCTVAGSAERQCTGKSLRITCPRKTPSRALEQLTFRGNTWQRSKQHCPRQMSSLLECPKHMPMSTRRDNDIWLERTYQLLVHSSYVLSPGLAKGKLTAHCDEPPSGGRILSFRENLPTKIERERERQRFANNPQSFPNYSPGSTKTSRRNHP